jgi:hypothetical protein
MSGDAATDPGGTSPIISDRLYRTASQGLRAGRELSFVFRLLTNVRIGVLERADEVVGCSFAADITVDARGVNIERAVLVVFNFVG